MSKLVLSFLLWVQPISALLASEHDTAASDVSINVSQTASVAETAAEPEIVPAPETAPETLAESNDPVAETKVTETVPETTVVTEEPSVSAAEVVVPPAAVADETAASVVVPATVSMIETAPAVTTDKVIPASPEIVATNFLKASKFELFAGASMLNFDYTEFDTNGAWLDEENGWLPGLLLGGTLYWPGNWYASLELNYYFGDVEYQGQTQSDDPALSGLYITSRSDADIFDTTAIAGYRFSAARVYAGLGYYFWRRNIHPTMTNSGLRVAGLLEFYSWTYALLGFNAPLFVNEDSRINLDIRVTRMLQAQMDVDFLGYGGYDNASLNLGEDWGLRLALPWTFQVSTINDATITIEPYYYRWDLNRSNVAELTVNGVGTGSGVVEPRSETRNLGISLYFRYSM